MNLPDRIPEQRQCLQRFKNKKTGEMQTCHKKLNHLGGHKS